MGAINHELVYEVRKRRLTIQSESNRRIGAENAARRLAEKEHGETVSAVAKLFGSDDLEFTNISCMADGIASHVFHPASEPSGLGRRKCIFCSCDDFND